MKKENRRKKLSSAHNDGQKKKGERTISSRSHSVNKDSACSQFTSVDHESTTFTFTLSLLKPHVTLGFNYHQY